MTVDEFFKELKDRLSNKKDCRIKKIQLPLDLYKKVSKKMGQASFSVSKKKRLYNITVEGIEGNSVRFL